MKNNFLTPEKREYLRVVLFVITLIFFLLMVSRLTVTAQGRNLDNHEPLTLDMRVQRIPVSSVQNTGDQSLSHFVSSIRLTAERVQLIFIGDKALLLITQVDTLELHKVKHQSGLFLDRNHNNQPYYVVYAVNRNHTFWFAFIPIATESIYVFRSEGYKYQTTHWYRTLKKYSISMEPLSPLTAHHYERN